MKKSEVLSEKLELGKLQKLSVNFWFKEFFGDSSKSYRELFRQNCSRLLSVLRSWNPRVPQKGKLSVRLERFFVLSLLRFFLSLVEFISLKIEKEELVKQLESVESQRENTCDQLGLLEREISFLKENLKMLRPKSEKEGKGEGESLWDGRQSSGDSDLKGSLERPSAKELDSRLSSKQKEIGDLSNMLERSEDTFESVLLGVLQRAEELAPLLICEKVLLAIFSKRDVLGEGGLDQFTKRRIIREKAKNLKTLLGGLGLLSRGSKLHFEQQADREDLRLVEGLEKVVKLTENFFKDNTNKKRTDKFFFSFCQNVHNLWTLTKKNEKNRHLQKWKENVERWK